MRQKQNLEKSNWAKGGGCRYAINQAIHFLTQNEVKTRFLKIKWGPWGDNAGVQWQCAPLDHPKDPLFGSKGGKNKIFKDQIGYIGEGAGVNALP